MEKVNVGELLEVNKWGGHVEMDVTAFDLFETEYKLKLLTVKVKCPKCGHIWGIKIEDYSNSVDIPERKFKCTECEI